MSKSIITILILSLFFLTACSVAENDEPTAQHLSDPLYCQRDSDCTAQTTSCSICSCPKPINKWHYEYMDCREEMEKNINEFCHRLCYRSPKCEENKCKLVEFQIK